MQIVYSLFLLSVLPQKYISSDIVVNVILLFVGRVDDNRISQSRPGAAGRVS